MRMKMALAGLVAGLVTMTASAAVADPPAGGIEDSVLLQAADLLGAQPTDGGPDPTSHPLPPQPCADAPVRPPLAARTRQATYQQRQIYQYVARYTPGAAAQVAEDLLAALTRCGEGPAGVRHRVAATGRHGPHSILLTREYDDGDRMDAYFVGVAGDLLVVVLDTGYGNRLGDLTTASGLGLAAIRRAGGDPTPVPSPTDATPPPLRWVTFESEVTGVRRGPTPETAVVDLSVPAGDSDCARDPRATNVVEENGRVYATFVADTLQDPDFRRCTGRAAASATLSAPSPLGERPLILNHQAWAPDGETYRRCDVHLGCHPPADHCDRAWLDRAIAGMDIPRHAYVSVKGCDGTWMVVDINTAAGDCGPVDPGPRPGCTVEPRYQRHFMRFGDGWTTVSRARQAGCAGVHAHEPAFPEALCRELPAL